LPDINDLEKIEKVLSEIGERELGIRGVTEKDIISENVKMGLEKEPVKNVAPGEEKDEFKELLKDIEVGLSEEKVLEEELSKENEVEKVAAGEIPKKEVAKEKPLIEEGFDLPGDFDMENINVEEGPPEELIRRREKLEEEVPEIEQTGEEILKEELPEVPLEEFEMPELEEIESLEKAEEMPPSEKEELKEFKMPEIEEGKVEEELPSIEEEIPEGIEKLTHGEKDREEKTKGIGIDLSDEDIVLIMARLKELDPFLASRIKDVILNVSIPVESLKKLVNLILENAPEEEVQHYIEWATGKKIEKKRIPRVVAVPEKRGRIQILLEKTGPLIRVTGLFVTVLALLSIIFMLFMYKPIKANKYYREGIECIRTEDYDKAEKSFSSATTIYDKVKEYENFGWEYMISGNYSRALDKFNAGIEKDKKLKNLTIREHRADLYNILGQYDKANEYYEEIIKVKPDKYNYIKKKGLNLIDWGLKNNEYYNEAYDLFNNEYVKNNKNSDPLFQMLYINIITNKKDDVDNIFDLLNRRHPKDVDEKIYTELAYYYTKQDRLEFIRDILSRVLREFPEYPKAFWVFGKYFKSIHNIEEEKKSISQAIDLEKSRRLEYPWDIRDRSMLSDAYNDLGEIYAGMEMPGKSAESIGYFKQAIIENERNSKAYFNLGQVYFYKEKSYEYAREYYEKAKSMGLEGLDEKTLYYNLGLLYYYKKDFYRALDYWSKLSQTIPENPNIGFALGNTFLYLKKYNSALGEFLILSEFYDNLIKGLGEIKPYRAYHKRILLEASAVYNNMGVAYQKLFESMGKPEYQKNSLVSLYKAGELSDIIGQDRGEIQYNINYIMHPEVIRESMAINDNISNNYQFIVQ